jgi:hypothetical protein
MYLWRQRVAVLFIVFAFADISVPGLCPSDTISGLPTPTFTNSQPGAQISSSPAIPDPVQPESGDEDCFCCSTHISPVFGFSLERQLAVVSILEPMPQNDLSPGIVVPPYHPPRA